MPTMKASAREAYAETEKCSLATNIDPAHIKPSLLLAPAVDRASARKVGLLTQNLFRKEAYSLV